ncbi:hypothetical protein LFT44_17460 [Arthrobacter sp. FW306-05-C]|uniref:hypothetical protein n=1 Tax=Arthrobacter TaxID=1663 RepID=UPI001EEF9C21|nr:MULTISPECIES: hypothetical protein [Arthrobacter]MDP9985400.1 hypothetical protein [Arthrobacter oryzae]UKA66253.1 hypothetical protein LFT44_17460 [Arthrobacter sp. FW306-05-C]UKA70600.1 hypothetical protein LFT49_18025 [Arthrobacter sp. FW306-06-A]UKA74904.1 hypothetical protein LFT46_17430 [Arthrobacter sp. FW306-07-I]
MNADWTGGPDNLLEADEQRRAVAQRFHQGEVPLVKLWTYYFGLGGDADEMSLDAYLNEALHLPAAQVGLITTAMTELSANEDE